MSEWSCHLLYNLVHTKGFLSHVSPELLSATLLGVGSQKLDKKTTHLDWQKEGKKGGKINFADSVNRL